MGGLGHVATGQIDDLARHRGAEEHGLTLRIGQRDQVLHIGQESQVQHLIGFVKDQNLYIGQIKVSLLGQVDKATRSADDNINTRVEGCYLWLVGATTINSEYAHIATRSSKF